MGRLKEEALGDGRIREYLRAMIEKALPLIQKETERGMRRWAKEECLLQHDNVREVEDNEEEF